MTRFYIDDSDEDLTPEETELNNAKVCKNVKTDEISEKAQSVRSIINNESEKTEEPIHEERDKIDNLVVENKFFNLRRLDENVAKKRIKLKSSENFYGSCEKSNTIAIKSSDCCKSLNTPSKRKKTVAVKSKKSCKKRKISKEIECLEMEIDAPYECTKVPFIKFFSNTDEGEKMDIDDVEMDSSNQMDIAQQSNALTCEIIAILHSKKATKMALIQQRQPKLRNVRWYKEKKNLIIQKILARGDLLPIIKDMLHKLAACSEIVPTTPCDFKNLMFGILHYDEKKHSNTVTDLHKLVRHDFLNLNREIHQVSPMLFESSGRKSSENTRRSRRDKKQGIRISSS